MSCLLILECVTNSMAPIYNYLHAGWLSREFTTPEVNPYQERNLSLPLYTAQPKMFDAWEKNGTPNKKLKKKWAGLQTEEEGDRRKIEWQKLVVISVEHPVLSVSTRQQQECWGPSCCGLLAFNKTHYAGFSLWAPNVSKQLTIPLIIFV